MSRMWARFAVMLAEYPCHPCNPWSKYRVAVSERSDPTDASPCADTNPLRKLGTVRN